MTVLVTGAAGFIGRHVLEALAGAGRPARGFDLAPLPGAAEHVVGNLLDPAAVARALAGVDAVIHIAGIGTLWQRDADAYERVNVDGTRRLAEAAKAAGVARFVHLSSAVTLVGAGSHRGAVVTEADRPPEVALFGPYCRSKRRAEEVLAGVGLGEPVVVLPTAPVGPGHRAQDARGTEPMAMLCDLLSGRTPAFLDCRLDLIDVRDLAQAILAALAAPPGRYLAAGHGVEFRALLALLAELSGRPMPRHRVPQRLALAAAVAQEAIARRTGKPPQASVAGVRIAGKSVRFDAGRSLGCLGVVPRPLAASLGDAIQWLQTVGVP
ncbi:MAG: NAD-dependent epimerase/dehydratase family protein [Rhodospirillaceae bacterium]|nr:NAD-dependent epimerase/dehydratase family protein [Rhodospirillaceae bacterium]